MHVHISRVAKVAAAAQSARGSLAEIDHARCLRHTVGQLLGRNRIRLGVGLFSQPVLLFHIQRVEVAGGGVQLASLYAGRGLETAATEALQSGEHCNQESCSAASD